MPRDRIFTNVALRNEALSIRWCPWTQRTMASCWQNQLVLSPMIGWANRWIAAITFCRSYQSYQNPIRANRVSTNVLSSLWKYPKTFHMYLRCLKLPPQDGCELCNWVLISQNYIPSKSDILLSNALWWKVIDGQLYWGVRKCAH